MCLPAPFWQKNNNFLEFINFANKQLINSHTLRKMYVNLKLKKTRNLENIKNFRNLKKPTTTSNNIATTTPTNAHNQHLQ